MLTSGNSERLPRAIPQGDLKAFFDVIEDPRDRALFFLIYHLGLRESEALLISLDDINLKDGRIKIRRLKNGIGAEYPLRLDTLKSLKKYLKVRVRRGPKLFTGRQGPLSSRRLRQLFSGYLKQAGLSSNYSLHSLRHSMAVHSLDAGKDISFIKDLLGHRNIQSSAIYARLSNPKRDSILRELEISSFIIKAS
jgi:integrase